jgi:hypothetical protein
LGQIRNVYKILIGKTEEKIPPGRLCNRLEKNIKMELQDI